MRSDTYYNLPGLQDQQIVFMLRPPAVAPGCRARPHLGHRDLPGVLQFSFLELAGYDRTNASQRLRRFRKAYHVEAEKQHRKVTLIDFKGLQRNVYQVTYEWTFRALNKKGNRADVVFLVNGVPVAIVENKNPKLPDAMERAIKQFRRLRNGDTGAAHDATGVQRRHT